MRRFIIAFAALLVFSMAGSAFAGISNPYCSVPPFIQVQAPSNVMLVLDYSGSMSFRAYKNEDYDSSKTYYGYFIPDKKYKEENGIWEITSGKGYSGSYLNWYYMARIDILRWILTGGRVVTLSSSGECISNGKTCSIYTDKKSCKKNKLCRWKKKQCIQRRDCSYYDNKPSKCNANDLCLYVVNNGTEVVETESGEKIKKEDVSTYNPATGKVEGILQEIEKRSQKPRMGAVIFGAAKVNGTRIKIKSRIGLSYTYDTLIDKINTTPASGYTPTKAALEEMYDLFSEDKNTIKEYGNVDPYKFDGTLVPCVKNFEIILSDGEWNTGYSTASPKAYDPAPVANAMWIGGNADLVDKIEGKQNVRTYSVAVFLNESSSGANALKWLSVYGNYDDLNNDSKPCGKVCPEAPVTATGGPCSDTSLEITENLENESGCNEVKKNQDGSGPYGFFVGKDPAALKASVIGVFSEILRRTSSGSAMGVLSCSGESGSNIVKALFYPKKFFDNQTSVDWTGRLYSLWFYLGPFAQNVREDTSNSVCTGEKCLNLKEDNVVDIYFDETAGSVEAKVCPDLNGDGKIDSYADASGASVNESAYCKVEPLSDIKPIWEAGEVLWSTDPSQRNIFVGLDLNKDGSIDKRDTFAVSHVGSLEPYLDTDNLTYADDIIKYIRGYDIPGFRSREATIGTTSGVWKLGDIVYSTPKIVTYSSFTPVNEYYKDYGDKSYKAFLDSLNYDNLSMVFVGANDGMLHAFRMGELSFPGGSALVALKKPQGGYGSEAWAFIPKNILPYLKYYMDKNYCHLYYVDLTPYIFDASINGEPYDTKTATSWRRILIGGLRFGGACGDNVTGAVTPPNDTGKVPAGVGMSSYFALDITDPENPKLLWEFTDKDLGFTTTGPAIIHIPYKKADGSDDNTKNGYWYVAFASGPDNYDGSVHRPLYMYVLNLKDGTLLRKLQLSGNGKLLGNIDAFAGRMVGSQTDLGVNYSDDVFYFGYTYNSAGTWKGGVIRVATGDESNVNNWVASKLIDNIGPVTASVAHIEDVKNGNLWLFFGEGRYFTKSDDPDGLRHLYGIKDPCYSAGRLPLTCTKSVSFDELTDVTDNPSANVSSQGWYITLQGKDSTYNAERLITDPIVNPVNGWVFFATFRPTGDICGFGGDTYEWVVGYANGGKAYNLAGTIFSQTSTGTIVRIDIAKEFSVVSKATSYGRKAGPQKGAPPLAIGGTILVPPSPLENIIHWRQGFVR